MPHNPLTALHITFKLLILYRAYENILIDCYRQKDKIVLWIKSENQNIMLEDKFIPKIYARIKLFFLHPFQNINAKQIQSVLYDLFNGIY